MSNIQLKSGKGEWEAEAHDKVSPENILVYLAKMGIFYRKVSESNVTPPVSRDIKNLLLKDIGVV